jgi:predicted nuclease of predicted toxin-antitoxin system
MKFLIDMPLSPDLASWLRVNGHDAVHAGEIGMHQAPDTAIVARAKLEDRTVITADLDYPQLLAMSRAIEPSVILFRDGNWSDQDVIARMGDVFAALGESEIAQSIVVVERDRIRRRRLPLGR